jgi:CubicO group peptidase (beta-lactamase class C family)
MLFNNTKEMLLIQTVILSLMISGFVSAQDKISNDSSIYAGLIKQFQEQIPILMSQKNNIGVAVALTDENDTIWAQGFGYTDINKKDAVNEETLFGLQSVSKTFTTVAALIAHQRKLVDLDSPIVKYLPDIHFNSRYEKDPEKNITIRHLLSHKSGLQAFAPLGNTYDWQPDRSWRGITFEEHIESMNNTWLKCPVGSEYNYSNCGVDLVGYILQKVSDEKFENYMADNLFKPMFLEQTVINPAYNNKNTAFGYAKEYNEIPLYTAAIPSGGIFSNVRDMSKFIRFFLNDGEVNGKRILDIELLNSMYKIPYNKNYLIAGYGLGMEIQTKDNTFIYGHSGGGAGFGARMLWYPKYKIGVIVLTNSMTGLSWDLAEKILNEAVKVKIASTGKQPTTIQYGYRTDINKYVGAYVLKRGGVVEDTFKVVIKNSILYINNNALEEIQDGIFYTRDGDVVDFKAAQKKWNNLIIEIITDSNPPVVPVLSEVKGSKVEPTESKH